MRSFSVKVGDEILLPGDEEEEAINEHDDDDGVTPVEARDARGVTRPPSVSSARGGGRIESDQRRAEGGGQILVLLQSRGDSRFLLKAKRRERGPFKDENCPYRRQ